MFTASKGQKPSRPFCAGKEDYEGRRRRTTERRGLSGGIGSSAIHIRNKVGQGARDLEKASGGSLRSAGKQVPRPVLGLLGMAGSG